MAALTPLSPTIHVRLPLAGWQIGFHAQPNGGCLVEVTDPCGSLAGLVASSQDPILSIAEGWAGHTCGPIGRRQWWALAIGHMPIPDGWPAVTFTRRTPSARTMSRLEAVDGLWVVHDGLWVAATTGQYSHVRITMQCATHVRRLRVVTSRAAKP